MLDSYRDPVLKGHLVLEAYGKCVYCESKITHLYFGDIEHIKPKSQFPAERLDVGNLALACAVCNNSKGNCWDDAVPLLNPYLDDPATELLALGYLVVRRPGHVRARVTIETLQLNRPELIERRKERIEMLQPLADQYAESQIASVKELLRIELCRYASDAAEYAFIVRAYLEAAFTLRCDDVG
ncbi:MAG: HNH endonuclease [Terriglobales bacterium]